jgi:hypothetical protein
VPARGKIDANDANVLASEMVTTERAGRGETRRSLGNDLFATTQTEYMSTGDGVWEVTRTILLGANVADTARIKGEHCRLGERGEGEGGSG